MWYHSHTKDTGWNNPKRKLITLLFHSLVWHKKKNIDASCVKARVHQWLTVQCKYMYLSLMLPARVRHTSELHAMLPRMPTQIS